MLSLFTVLTLLLSGCSGQHPDDLALGARGCKYKSVSIGDQVFLSEHAEFSSEGEMLDEVPGKLVPDDNYHGCEPFPSDYFSGKVAVIFRGLCMFEQKTTHAQQAGAVAVIVANWAEDLTSIDLDELVTMADTDLATPTIPALFVSYNSGLQIMTLLADSQNSVTIRCEPKSGRGCTCDVYVSTPEESFYGCDYHGGDGFPWCKIINQETCGPTRDNPVDNNRKPLQGLDNCDPHQCSVSFTAQGRQHSFPAPLAMFGGDADAVNALGPISLVDLSSSMTLCGDSIAAEPLGQRWAALVLAGHGADYEMVSNPTPCFDLDKVANAQALGASALVVGNIWGAQYRIGGARPMTTGSYSDLRRPPYVPVFDGDAPWVTRESLGLAPRDGVTIPAMMVSKEALQIMRSGLAQDGTMTVEFSCDGAHPLYTPPAGPDPVTSDVCTEITDKDVCKGSTALKCTYADGGCRNWCFGTTDADRWTKAAYNQAVTDATSSGDCKRLGGKLKKGVCRAKKKVKCKKLKKNLDSCCLFKGCEVVNGKCIGGKVKWV